MMDEQSLTDMPAAQPDRLAEPVDTEEPPRLEFPVVGIGVSAGGLEAYLEFLKAMRSDSGMAFVLIQHLPPDRESMVAEILSKRTAMKVLQVDDGMKVEPNHVYVIRPGYTLTLRQGLLRLGASVERPGHSRPVDDFFRSLAEEQRERGICIIMSGMGSNGTAGAQAVKAVGGMCIAQDPETAQFPSMPRHLIDAGYADYILRAADMPDVLMAYARHPYARDGRENARHLMDREQQSLREILAVMRTRTRQDFSGYKKPTILRRLQRRMGLNRVTQLAEYARILRQSPTEVAALSDDLLIHVTGFFRDPEVWESLRQLVIVPLVATRESDTPVRCWVTACSSGEEAYSLAILLVEEAERMDKRLDIKVFATDMAERTLQNARHGLFPGGIEGEVSPERLERFFQREDAVYRVRQELRERVVFAPQNVLQDPPFSRLDIITCRNLLIYLEPNVQRRLLSLLHFGLREGGALLLGTSETIGGTEELFSPIDKKCRIFRRVGPTRHGSLDFPLPHVSPREINRIEVRNNPRPSITALTTRALLEFHMPAAVTVDREYRIVYFHGNTDQYLAQPRGEATRDLFAMVRESVRGALRSALQQAIAKNTSVTLTDGWLENERHVRQRIAVTVSPLDHKNAPDYFVVSFQERGEVTTPASHEAEQNANVKPVSEPEVLRMRDELQSTIEELQTSNEELKASHEEVVSINEELQSTNEELETSREEMQSLNEELATVNSQLHAKMEEHQSARNDLASLLTSTDIAVLFLDTKFRIRRFTPAVKDLLELIQSDVGRPFSDLARKFNDPELVLDSEAVLERLMPIEREIEADEHRWYLRRVLPYRTADNRIDGVVVTFLDITHRKAAEAERTMLLQREQASRAEAEAANRLKDDFLATISHELRTPLTAILLWAKVLHERPDDLPQLEEGLAAIKNSAEAQRELIEDLLDTSRIVSGNLRLFFQSVDVSDVVHRAIETVSPAAQAKNISIQTDISEALGVISADRNRLQQIIWNLLTNAVKFTISGGFIRVSASRSHGEIEIRVSDDGQGIAPDFLPRIFERFRQANSSTTRSQSGLGLGLTITKQLVEVHGGTIIAQSDGLGTGSTFVVRLPIPDIIKEIRNAKVEASIPLDGETRIKGIHILIVEDNDDTRVALTALMTNAGAKVTAVDRAQTALQAVRANRPDVIVSDIGLPDEDGYSLMVKIRKEENQANQPRIPAIALSAFSSDENRKQSLESGFQRHLIKPMDPDTLIHAIAELVSHQPEVDSTKLE